MYDYYESKTDAEKLADLNKAAHDYNKSLPVDSKEYWVVDGANMRLKKIPREQMANVVFVGRAMKM